MWGTCFVSKEWRRSIKSGRKSTRPGACPQEQPDSRRGKVYIKQTAEQQVIRTCNKVSEWVVY